MVPSERQAGTGHAISPSLSLLRQHGPGAAILILLVELEPSPITQIEVATSEHVWITPGSVSRGKWTGVDWQRPAVDCEQRV